MLAATGLSSSMAPAQSWMPDGAGAIWAYGRSVDVYGAEAHWDSPRFLDVFKRLNLETRVVADIAYWSGRQRPTDNPSLVEVGATPFVRWVAPGGIGDARVFVEAGIGVHALSHHLINNDRDFGGSFQFGEQGGVGIAFGRAPRYELVAYIQHVSNAKIKEPNDGITFTGAILRATLP